MVLDLLRNLKLIIPVCFFFNLVNLSSSPLPCISSKVLTCLLENFYLLDGLQNGSAAIRNGKNDRESNWTPRNLISEWGLTS